ncbi:MAG: thioesterase family protein, partial [Acidimicrobiia bacterium]
LEQATPGRAVTRATFDIHRGIPKVPVTIDIDVTRPGKKVTHLTGRLLGPEGESLLMVSAWAIRESDDGLPVQVPDVPPFPDPEDCPPLESPFGEWTSYLDAVDVRVVSGTPFQGGQGAVWVRQTVPLIEGEQADPANLLGLFGDLGSGIGAIESFTTLLGINTDLTVYAARRPQGDWIGLESMVISHGRGLGMTDSLIYDASGFVGKANQSMFFDRR